MCKVYGISPVAALELEIDSLAKLTMTYTAEGLQELQDDISNNGQIQPVLLRDGKILDGRHRLKVCVALGVDLMCKEVGSITNDEALDIVISNSINKSTKSDASKTEAYLLCRAKGVPKMEMPNKFKRLNSNYVSKLSFIEKENPEYLTVLLNQNMVKLYNQEFKKVEDYGTINGLWRTLKGNKKLGGTVVEVVPEPVTSAPHSVNLEEYFNNPVAEDEYWEILNTAKNDGTNLHPDTALGKKIASLIKHKYSRE